MNGGINLVEYLYDAIRAVAEQDIVINAIATDDEEQIITSGCCLVLHDDDVMLYRAEGVYLPDYLTWEFVIPSEITKGLKGRYWYCIQHDNNNLCFKQPIYLM